MSVIIEDRAKRQLERYGIKEDKFLEIANIEGLANDESSMKHNIIFPIEIYKRRYTVSARKEDSTIIIKKIQRFHISI